MNPTNKQYDDVVLLDGKLLEAVGKGKLITAVKQLGKNVYAIGKEFVQDIPHMRDEVNSLSENIGLYKNIVIPKLDFKSNVKRVKNTAKGTWSGIKSVCSSIDSGLDAAWDSLGKFPKRERSNVDIRKQIVLGMDNKEYAKATSYQKGIAKKSAMDIYNSIEKEIARDPSMKVELIEYSINAARADGDSATFEVMLAEEKVVDLENNVQGFYEGFLTAIEVNEATKKE